MTKKNTSNGSAAAVDRESVQADSAAIGQAEEGIQPIASTAALRFTGHCARCGNHPAALMDFLNSWFTHHLDPPLPALFGIQNFQLVADQAHHSLSCECYSTFCSTNPSAVWATLSSQSLLAAQRHLAAAGS